MKRFPDHVSVVCSYTPSLSRRVTHLVVAADLDKGSEKLETARKKTASGSWKVATVSLKWLQLCVSSCKLHPTAEYAIHFEAPPGPPSGLAVGTSRTSQPTDSNTVASVVTGVRSTEPASCLQPQPYDELDAHGGRAACSSRVSISRAAPQPTAGDSPGSRTAQVSTPALHCSIVIVNFTNTHRLSTFVRHSNAGSATRLIV